MDWFLYDIGLRQKRVKRETYVNFRIQHEYVKK